jgi:hypothetical protein
MIWLSQGIKSIVSGLLELGLSILVILLMVYIIIRSALKCCSKTITKGTQAMVYKLPLAILRLNLFQHHRNFTLLIREIH